MAVDPPLGRVPLADRAQVLLDLLVDRGVHEEREDDRRRPVDRHRDRRRRRAEIEAGVEALRVVDGRDRDARVADLAVDVGPRMGILAVERDRVERGREAHRAAGRPRGSGSGGWSARACPRRRTCGSGPRPRGGRGRRRPCTGTSPAGSRTARKRSWSPQPRVARRRDLGDAQPAQRVAVVVAGDRPAAHVVGVRLRGDPLDPRRRAPERLDGLGCRAPRAPRCRRRRNGACSPGSERSAG